MTKKEAEQLASELHRDFPGRIQAFPEPHARGFRLRVLLVTGQRLVLLYQRCQWQEMLEAWQEFLGIEVPGAALPTALPRYLVDGVSMAIFRRKDGAWIGTYTQNKKTCKRYFGKVDPRPKYAECEA